MTIDAFRKALHHRPLSQQEQDELTPHELFVQVLARRLDRLTEEEQQRLEPEDWQYLAWAGLIPNGAKRRESSSTTVIGASPRLH
jgi:hypothetical protein